MVLANVGLAGIAVLGAALLMPGGAGAQTATQPGNVMTNPPKVTEQGRQMRTPEAAAKPATPPALVAPPPSTPAPAVKNVTAGRTPETEYKECLALWEAATHMTRAEWAATCRRVQNRLNAVTTESQITQGRRRVR